GRRKEHRLLSVLALKPENIVRATRHGQSRYRITPGGKRFIFDDKRMVHRKLYSATICYLCVCRDDASQHHESGDDDLLDLISKHINPHEILRSSEADKSGSPQQDRSVPDRSPHCQKTKTALAMRCFL